jgi:hypothetical protein
MIDADRASFDAVIGLDTHRDSPKGTGLDAGSITAAFSTDQGSVAMSKMTRRKWPE